MSYQATKWENRDKATGKTGTKLNADNMNNIEKGIEDIEKALTTLTNQITPEQLTILDNVSKSLEALQAVQTDLGSLKKQFEEHVHSNVVGETTGEVVVETTNA